MLDTCLGVKVQIYPRYQPHEDVISLPLCKPVCSSVKWGSPFLPFTFFPPRAERVPVRCGLLPTPHPVVPTKVSGGRAPSLPGSASLPSLTSPPG